MSTHGSAAAAGRLTLPRGDALLRLALRLDAVVTGANGAAYLAAAPAIDGPLGVDAGLLRGVGAFLLGYAAIVWIVASRDPVPAAGARAVVAVNLVWAFDSVAVAAFGWGSPAGARRRRRAPSGSFSRRSPSPASPPCSARG